MFHPPEILDQQGSVLFAIGSVWEGIMPVGFSPIFGNYWQSKDKDKRTSWVFPAYFQNIPQSLGSFKRDRACLLRLEVSSIFKNPHPPPCKCVKVTSRVILCRDDHFSTVFQHSVQSYLFGLILDHFHPWCTEMVPQATLLGAIYKKEMAEPILGDTWLQFYWQNRGHSHNGPNCKG